MKKPRCKPTAPAPKKPGIPAVRLRADRYLNVCSEPLGALLDRFGITAWDYLLVGDGSGTVADKACGWSCVAIDRLKPNERLDVVSASSHGTVQFAELMAYLQTLDWLREYERVNRRAVGVRHIHILTDSEYCRQQGQQRNRSGREAHSPLWHAFDAFNHSGFLLTWHHAPRTTVGLNIYADHRSRGARMTLALCLPRGPVVHRDHEVILSSVEEFNPASPLSPEPASPGRGIR